MKTLKTSRRFAVCFLDFLKKSELFEDSRGKNIEDVVLPIAFWIFEEVGIGCNENLK